MSDPTEALAAALLVSAAKVPSSSREYAGHILAALPDDAAVVTVDSLAAAHATLKGHDGGCSSVFGRCASWDAVYATFQAAKEVEGE